VSKIKVTILGSGAAPGVPSIGHGWGACNPDNPKNIRSRTGTYLEFGETKLLIDTSPDIRAQMLNNKIGAVNGILYTHSHSDHVGGIDEMRELNRLTHKNVDIFCTQDTYNNINHRYGYLINHEQEARNVMLFPSLYPNIIENYNRFTINSVDITPVKMSGHSVETNGFVFNNGQIVYLADFKSVDEEVYEQIKVQPELLIIPCTNQFGATYHATLDEVKEVINKINPKQAIINHMAIENDYDFMNENTDNRTFAGYDNMTIEL